jgi:hypothetical protein
VLLRDVGPRHHHHLARGKGPVVPERAAGQDAVAHGDLRDRDRRGAGQVPRAGPRAKIGRLLVRADRHRLARVRLQADLALGGVDRDDLAHRPVQGSLRQREEHGRLYNVLNHWCSSWSGRGAPTPKDTIPTLLRPDAQTPG